MNQILSSWKEIAVFFGKGVRTVQRWEQQLGLPIHRPADAPQNIVMAHSEELLAWLNATTRRQRKAVLFAEDDPMQRALVQSFLEMAGYDVTACAQAEECLEKFQASPQVDMLLTDMHMPGMDGIALIERMHGLRPGLPAILISADHSSGETLAQLRAERCFFLPKPFLFPQLQETLQKCLGPDVLLKNHNLLSFPSPKALAAAQDAKAG